MGLTIFMERDEILQRLGKRVKFFRNKKRYTQEFLAELIGCHWKSISLLERGKLNPSLMFLLKLCDALDVSFSDLFPNLKGGSYSVRNEEIFALVSDVLRDGSSEDTEALKSILKAIQKMKKKGS